MNATRQNDQLWRDLWHGSPALRTETGVSQNSHIRQIQAALPEGVRLPRTTGTAGIEPRPGNHPAPAPFHFDRNGLGRLLGKDPPEIELDVARRGSMEANSCGHRQRPIQDAPTSSRWRWRSCRQLFVPRVAARMLLQVHDELVLEVAPDAQKAT